MQLDVFLRSCSRVVAVNNTPRPMGVSKSELSLRCLATLIDSMSRAVSHPHSILKHDGITFTIIDDHSDPRYVKIVRSMLTHCPFSARFLPMETGDSGNGASLNLTYHQARTQGRELIYFVEDDYLHDPDAIHSMVMAFVQETARFGKDVCIFPCDYIDLYRQPQVSAIMLAQDRYWRTVTTSTGTMMVSKRIVESHWHCFMGLARYDIDRRVNESNTINLIYKDHPCLSPMPSLAIHMHEGMESPYAPWQHWWQRIAPLASRWSRPLDKQSVEGAHVL